MISIDHVLFCHVTFSPEIDNIKLIYPSVFKVTFGNSWTQTSNFGLFLCPYLWLNCSENSNERDTSFTFSENERISYTPIITGDICDYFIPVNVMNLLVDRYDFRNLRNCRNYQRDRYDTMIKKHTHKILHLRRKQAFIGELFENISLQ